MPEPPTPDRSPEPQPAPNRADRDQAISRLTDAFAADELTLEEFEQRVEQAYSARSSTALATLTSDLPAPPPREKPVVFDKPLQPRMTAVFSSVERRSQVAVPEHVRITSVFGNIELDLSDARFDHEVTVLEVHAVFGNVEIKVPADVIVEGEGGAAFGSFAVRSAAAPGSGARHVIVRGAAVFGNVEVDSRLRLSVSEQR